MEENTKIENLFSEAKDYLETRIELARLQTVEKTSELAGSAVVGLLLLILFTLVFLFASVAFGFYMSEKTGEYSTGFLSVAGIYFLLGLLIYFTRESRIKKPVSNHIIQKMLNDEE